METFIARQPIFDKNQNVYAYELLFRNGFENYVNMDKEKEAAEDASRIEDALTADVIKTSFTSFNFKKLIDNKKAFINFTDRLIREEIPLVLPRKFIGVEILENIKPTLEIITALKKLKDKNYILALDDFLVKDLNNPLVKFVDIIKVDFLENSPDDWKLIIDEVKLKNKSVKCVAEKVESVEDFRLAVSYGYDYFQGFFFSKPEVLKGHEIPANKLNLVRILAEINKTNVGFKELDEIFKTDVSLSLKLLKFINSSFFGLNSEVKSIKHALVMLGVIEIKKLVSIVSFTNLRGNKSEELIITSLIRANFCEKMSIFLKKQDIAQESFMLGMFSVIDGLLDRPMKDILVDFPLEKNIKLALMNENDENCFYGKLLKLINHLERGNWEELIIIFKDLNIPDKEVSAIYTQSIEIAESIYKTAK